MKAAQECCGVLIHTLWLCTGPSSSITAAVHIFSMSLLLVCQVANTTYLHSMHVIPHDRSFTSCLHALLRGHSSGYLFMSEGKSCKRLEIHIYRQILWHRSHHLFGCCTKENQIYWIIEIRHDADQLYWKYHSIKYRKPYNTWWDNVAGGAFTRSHQQSLQWRLVKTVACAAGPLMISFFWSSVIFSAAYCLLLGGIKLCVGAVGLLWRRRMEEGWRDGGRGGIFLCDMGHWLFFHSSGTIMRFFFLFFRISVPPFSALIVFMKLCIHLSMLEQGKESYFQNISKLFSVIVQRLIRVCVV